MLFRSIICKGRRVADENKHEILKTSIEEQRRLYDTTSNIYDQLRIKALALIAGEVAIATFLFTDWDVRKILIGSDRIFFFFTGVVLCGLAFGFLLWIISTVPWKMAHNFDTAQAWFSDKNHNSHTSFLEHLHDDYCNVNKYCANIVTKKCEKSNWAVFMLSAGIIILMVIKFGGPQ